MTYPLLKYFLSVLEGATLGSELLLFLYDSGQLGVLVLYTPQPLLQYVVTRSLPRQSNNLH